ncbi:uncharacterized protein LOC122330609 [Puntigrus tetrazona]|uniref:uncharacterized protein LOC122330609 n=1 Tax=Puntigrus tetrazona TaxID=1606681 RepID=UPI001C8A8CCD|nr:uncharacterized protein LOC122330609 [Puntigrus tetrazona]
MSVKFAMYRQRSPLIADEAIAIHKISERDASVPRGPGVFRAAPPSRSAERCVAHLRDVAFSPVQQTHRNGSGSAPLSSLSSRRRGSDMSVCWTFPLHLSGGGGGRESGARRQRPCMGCSTSPWRYKKTSRKASLSACFTPTTSCDSLCSHGAALHLRCYLQQQQPGKRGTDHLGHRAQIRPLPSSAVGCRQRPLQLPGVLCWSVQLRSQRQTSHFFTLGSKRQRCPVSLPDTSLQKQGKRAR